MSNFDDKNFIPKLTYKKYYQNLTDKMFIIFGIEFIEASEFFEFFRKGKNQYPQDTGSHKVFITAVNHSALARIMH